MNKKQKKIFFCVCMIFFLFLIVTIYLLKQKSPYEYLKEQKGMTAQTTANECLEEIRFDNKYIVFFINENGNLSCAVMKKKIFSYEILRISGELSQSKNSKNYLFSSYEDNGYKWIDWGVINDSDRIASTTRGLETNRRGCLVADEVHGQTSREGIFAGGDAVTGAATVILAMGAGRRAARAIDEYVRAKSGMN